MITLYGIPNCDTIKKARQWLAAHNIDYVFHDYKKLGVPENEFAKWVKQLGWDVLLNQRGTTWRNLDKAAKANINQSSAIKIMLENPGIIKRPVLDLNGKYFVGFSEPEYKKIMLTR